MRHLLELTAARAADFLEGLAQRPVYPDVSVDELRSRLGVTLQEEPLDPVEVVEDLVAAADPGVVAIPSGRYFGFVIGGGVPAAVAADWLTAVWDQNAGLYAAGPSASVVEEVAGGWLRELLGLPGDASFAFVTGTQMAHVTALAAARLAVLRDAGWDVSRDGLFGAPSIRVVTGELHHITLVRALRLLGFGTASIVPVECDDAGRMRVDRLRDALAVDGPTIVCAQVGEVNSGAIDPVGDIVAAARETGAWVHVDGAFGLWAAAAPSLRDRVAGVELADSWSVDAHKWLNVPYDSGVVFCAHPDAHRAAMAAHADYLVHADEGAQRDEVDWTPEFSRRARGFAVYAALRSLGRAGIAQLVERSCAHARRFAEELAAEPGVEVINDVVLNQVLVRFHDDDERTRQVLAAVQRSGEAWMSGSVWRGRAVMRISVSNWQTNDDDVSRAIAAIAAASRAAAASTAAV